MKIDRTNTAAVETVEGLSRRLEQYADGLAAFGVGHPFQRLESDIRIAARRLTATQPGAAVPDGAIRAVYEAGYSSGHDDGCNAPNAHGNWEKAWARDCGELLAAVLVPEAAERAVAVPLVDASFEAFNEITGLCSNLREGGPVPEDLEGLSSGLESAIDIAANMLAKISDSRSAPIPQQPAADGAAVNKSLTTEGAEAVYQYQTVTNGWHDLLDAADSEKYKAAGWPVRTLYTHPTPAADAGGVMIDELAMEWLEKARYVERKTSAEDQLVANWPIAYAVMQTLKSCAAELRRLTPEVSHGE